MTKVGLNNYELVYGNIRNILTWVMGHPFSYFSVRLYVGVVVDEGGGG